MKKILASISFFAAQTTLFADEASETTRDPHSFWQTLIMIAIAIVFFYFILWRPEQKKRKAMAKKRESMKKGDQVTAMGIIGTLEKIKEKTIILTMVDGSKVEFLKAAINEVVSKEELQKED